jgi:hypothetical protein
MLNHWYKLKAIGKERGQSLVETAIFFPILIFILAGAVEIGNLLNTQNKVTTAARSAAGFGAANYDRDDWDGTASAMGQVALNTVTQTLELTETLWDIWSIQGQTNSDGDDFDFFVANHVYGNHVVVPADAWIAIEAEVKADILAELQSAGVENANDLEFVASVAYHNINTILGLPVWQWTGLRTIRGLTVMRVSEMPPYVGCPLLPISVRYNQYSVYPSNWTPELKLNATQYPNDQVALFPVGNGPTGFEYPNPAPVYVNGNTAPALRAPTFDRNWPGVPLVDARPGYVFWAREEGPSGSFGWLSWREPSSSENLRDSLTWPGNFLDPEEGYPGSPADMGETGDPPGDDTGDGFGDLNIGEWVENSTGNISSASAIIEGYINSGTPVTLIVTDGYNGSTGSNANYRVAGFAIVKILGYSFQGSGADRWLIFEFVDWGAECVSLD